MTIGEKIRKARQNSGITQKELGKRLGGLSQQQIGQWETGKANPKYETLQKIAEALEIPLFEFLDDDLFDAATEPATMENAMHEVELMAHRLKSIQEDTTLSVEEKRRLTHDFYIQTEIMADMHLTNAKLGDMHLFEMCYDALNAEGRDKARELFLMLTKIPEYLKENNPDY